MAQRNPPPGLPWTGIAALSAAAFAAGAVIMSVDSIGSLLHPWYLTRGAGFLAYILLWLSVSAGLLQSTQFLKGASSPLANIDLHTFLGVAALYATTFHAVILMWDKYVPFSAVAVLVPFAADYKPVLVGLGGLAFYISLLVTVTTYVRAKLSAKLWRSIHLSSLGGFLLALLHGLMLGTDSGHPAAAFLYRFTGLSVAVLTGWRLYLEVRKRYADSAGGRRPAPGGGGSQGAP